MVHVATPHQLATRPEQGEDARGNGALLAPLAGAEQDAFLQQRHLLAQRGRVQRVAPGEAIQHGLRGSLHPGRPVGGHAGLGDVLGEPAELGCRHPGRSAAPRRGQEVARKGEQGAAHRELLHQ